MKEPAGLVQKSIWLLRAVSHHPQGLGLSDLSRQVGLPKATCYRIAAALETEDCLRFDPMSRRYSLSIGLMGIVAGLIDNQGPYAQVKEILQRLSEETGETAGFDLLQPPHVLVLAQVSSSSLIGHTAKPVPRVQSVSQTASGRAMLATWSEADVRKEFLADTSPEVSEIAIGTLREARESVTSSGYAASVDELEKGATSVAAPVPGTSGHTYGVWVGGPSFRLRGEALEDAGKAVQRAAFHFRAIAPHLGENLL